MFHTFCSLALMLSIWAAWMLPATAAAEPGPNLVRNGDFEQPADQRATPLDWQTSGRGDIDQSLTLDTGHAGDHSAKLTCTQFVGGTPDAHVMMCQLGTVGIQRGKWYRLSFWIKGDGLTKPVGSVAVSNTRPWGASGVEGQFVAGATWRQVELYCQASDNVPAQTSRLQFWYSGTGTMWFDEIMLQEVDLVERFHPAIAPAASVNLIPNSSFECGAAQWGSYSPRISTWAGNINQQWGAVDRSTAQHAAQSLRIDVDKSQAPVFHWDYYEPIVEPVLTVVCANEGWIPVQVGHSYVFSCYLKSDHPQTPALLLVHHAQRGSNVKTIVVDQQWTRYEFSFRPRSDFIWIGAGIDLSESELSRATLWLDAAQLEPGEKATAYTTRAPWESTISSSAVGNIFSAPDEGLSIDLHLYNNTDVARPFIGRLTAVDFFDREALSLDVSVEVSPHSGQVATFPRLLAGRPGFYRVAWTPANHLAPFSQSLRCALLTPYAHNDSPFGMNHAYPWDFLLDLSRHAGLTWMRDWSAKWNTVEPERGEWDFSRVDPQINRVVQRELNLLLLLPFPSANWCSAADREQIERQVGSDPYVLNRSVAACPATDPDLFRQYVAKTTERYRDRTDWIEIMNEPLYTTYAVPATFGYGLEDYLQVLRDAHAAIKATSPQTRVIGGIGCWVDSHWVKDFVAAGGLEWCDAMDIHLYPITAPPETYEADLDITLQALRSRGESKPIWLTEFGCYADDDPYKTPGQIGDSAMSRANWGSELAASEALVKSAAVFLSHGIDKIFYHAGTCGPFNSSSGGGIFFEYGGAPSKMFAAQNVLARLLGPHPRPVDLPSSPQGLRRYVFETEHEFVAIVWTAGDQPVPWRLQSGVTALDMMGGELPGGDLHVTSTPVYLRANRPEDFSWQVESPSAQ